MSENKPKEKRMKKPVNTNSKSTHYVDNDKLFEEMSKHREAWLKYKAEGGDPPRVSEYIGECILMIAERLASKPNFVHYTYKEEMISTGVENCILYLHNWDPEKSSKVFSYFTTIIFYAFLRTIDKEKKQQYIKTKLFETKDIGKKLSVSAGVAGADQTMTKADELINLADHALYKAKDLGRDLCVTYEDRSMACTP